MKISSKWWSNEKDCVEEKNKENVVSHRVDRLHGTRWNARWKMIHAQQTMKKTWHTKRWRERTRSPLQTRHTHTHTLAQSDIRCPSVVRSFDRWKSCVHCTSVLFFFHFFTYRNRRLPIGRTAVNTLPKQTTATAKKKVGKQCERKQQRANEANEKETKSRLAHIAKRVRFSIWLATWLRQTFTVMRYMRWSLSLAVAGCLRLTLFAIAKDEDWKFDSPNVVAPFAVSRDCIRCIASSSSSSIGC